MKQTTNRHEDDWNFIGENTSDKFYKKQTTNRHEDDWNHTYPSITLLHDGLKQTTNRHEDDWNLDGINNTIGFELEADH